MKQTQISGQDVYLLYQEPNWESPVECSFRILSDTERGLTGKEDRTPLSMSLRASLSFDTFMHREGLAEFNNALKALANDPVLCPFWPAASTYSATNKDGVSSGYWVVWEPDWETWEIYQDGGAPGSFTPSAKARKAPLLWGRFSSDPAPEAQTDELETVSISFIDNSDIINALTVGVQSFVSGPSSHLVFPKTPNWGETLEAGQTRYEIVKNEIGFGRQTADAYYEQEGARIMAQTFACTNWTEFKKMLRFFFDAVGTVGRFWLPMAVAGCRLLEPTTTTSSTSSDAVPEDLRGTIEWSVSSEVVNGEAVYYSPEFELDFPETVEVSGAVPTDPNRTLNRISDSYYASGTGALPDDTILEFDSGGSGLWDIYEAQEGPGAGTYSFYNTADASSVPKTNWQVSVGTTAPTLSYELSYRYAYWYSTTHGWIISHEDDVGNESAADFFKQNPPDTITVSETGTSTDAEMSFIGFSGGKPQYTNVEVPSSLIFLPSGPEWYLSNSSIFEEWTNSSSDYLPPKSSGWSIGTMGSPAPVLEYTTPDTYTGQGSWSGTITFSLGTQTLQVDNAEGLGSNTHLACIQKGSADIYEIDSIDTGANTITLTSAVVRAYTPASTVLSPAVLARYQTDEASFEFITDELSVASLNFIEVPKEVAETDSGPEETVAYLYQFELENHPTTYFTSFEQDLTYNTNTYLADKFSHSEVMENINLEKADVTLESRYSETNPLRYYRPFVLEAPLNISIIQVTLDSDAAVLSASTIFKGQVDSAEFDGPMISAKCVGIGGLFDRMVPNMLMQPTCNYAVYSGPCGLDEDDWEMSAQVVEYPFNSDPYKILVQAPSFVLADPRPTRPTTLDVFEHYFAGGRFVSGTGTEQEGRGILDSDHTTNAPNVILSLRSPLENAPTPVVDTVKLWPGCDGRPETCKLYNDPDNLEGKFDNFENFGGFPFVPIGNPTLAKVNKDYSQGGKK